MFFDSILPSIFFFQNSHEKSQKITKNPTGPTGLTDRKASRLEPKKRYNI